MRYVIYDEVDAYFCLSLFEGGSYFMSDAEVLGLFLVSMDVGNFREYIRVYTFSWAEWDDSELVFCRLDEALVAFRQSIFFESVWFREEWLSAWCGLVEEVVVFLGCDPFK